MQLKHGVWALTLFFLAYICPLFLNDHVIAPHILSFDTDASKLVYTQQLQNYVLHDYYSAKIPNIIKSIVAEQSSLIGTWDPWNGLGQPVVNSSGRVENYLPTLIVSALTRDPFIIYSFIALSACYLAGIFTLLLCVELKLSVAAGLIAAITLSVSPAFMWWLTPFSVFILTICWCIAMLFAITRCLNKRRLTETFLLIFFTYNFLITGHPQLIVYHSYFIVAYTLFLLHGKYQTEGIKSCVSATLPIAAAMFGATLIAAPYLMDLLDFRNDSARVTPPIIDFFTFAFTKNQLN